MLLESEIGHARTPVTPTERSLAPRSQIFPPSSYNYLGEMAATVKYGRNPAPVRHSERSLVMVYFYHITLNKSKYLFYLDSNSYYLDQIDLSIMYIEKEKINR